MRIGFVVNDVATEEAEFSTTRLAMAARNREHEVWLMGVGDLAQNSAGEVVAHARGPENKSYRSLKTFLGAIQQPEDGFEKITVDDLDVLMLRNDPSTDALERPWAQTSGVLFG
ncbi:MAG TPA: glutathione synthase, partial [Acidimicrobiia bacterium]